MSANTRDLAPLYADAASRHESSVCEVETWGEWLKVHEHSLSWKVENGRSRFLF